MMNDFMEMLRDESGASAAEYALILAIVGSAIAFAAVALGSSISSAMGNAKNCIDNPPTQSGTTAQCTAATTGTGTGG
jgi:pilus assembly protein Flp/PilA